MAVSTSFDLDQFAEQQDIEYNSEATKNVAMTELASGGFASIADVQGGGLVLALYNSAGFPVITHFKGFGSKAAIDQMTNGNIVVASENETEVQFSIQNGQTGETEVFSITVGRDLGQNSNSNVKVAALQTGGFVLAYQAAFAGNDRDIVIEFRDADGSNPVALDLDAGQENDTSPDIVQLDDGGLVIAWTRTVGTSTQVWYAIREIDGSVRLPQTQFDATGTINRNVSVAAVTGGFAISYEDNQWLAAGSVDKTITLATFNSDGTGIGKFNSTPSSTSEISGDLARLDTLVAPNMIGMAVIRGNTTFAKLIDLTTGAEIFSRDVLGDIDGADPIGPAIVGYADGRVAVGHSDSVVNPADGQSQNIVRRTVSDSLPGQGDTMTGDRLIDYMTGGEGDDIMSGKGNKDELDGQFGDDTLDGGEGTDKLNGGDGKDTASYASSSAGVTVNLLTGLGSGGEAQGDTYVSIESAIGSALADRFIADASANTFTGGDGLDTVDYSASTDSIFVDLRNSTGSGGLATGDFLLEIENVVGGKKDDNLNGADSENRLDGGVGSDILQGRGGNDLYIVDNAGDRIIEVDGEGDADRVSTSASYVLAAGVSVELVLAANAALATVINLAGNEFGQLLQGNAGANILRGFGGNDTLNGLTGADTMDGGSGNDRFVVDTLGDRIIEAGGGGSDTALTTVSYVLTAGAEIELFTTANAALSAALALTGNALGQTIQGNAGENILNGGGGKDVLHGFAGNDKYFVDSIDDVVVEAAGAGNDRVSSVSSYVLGSGVEVELLTTTNTAGTATINLVGNTFAQTIQGNAGANLLNGGGGRDILQGFGGDDRYFVDSGNDIVLEAVGGGNDRISTSVSYVLTGNAEIELFTTSSTMGLDAIDLTGNAFGQTIHGNNGVNTINGGGGNDTLQGFGGQDLFLFNTGPNSVSNVDRIVDFSPSDDTIVLVKAVYTKLSGTGVLTPDQIAANLTGEATDALDRIIYETDTGKLFYDPDGLNGVSAIQFAVIAPNLVLANEDFFLI